MGDFIDPTKYLPGNKTFFTYPGSLATPPLFESVTWIVFKEPVEVSEAQLDVMRSLKIGEEEGCCDCMVDNFRPPCDLKGRTVKVVTAYSSAATTTNTTALQNYIQIFLQLLLICIF